MKTCCILIRITTLELINLFFIIIKIYLKIENQNNEMNNLQEEVNALKALSEPTFLKNFVELLIQVMKHVASESQRDEVRHFGKSVEEILINKNYPWHYMGRNLFDRVVAMVSEKKSSTSIFLTMATSLIPDSMIWGSNLI